MPDNNDPITEQETAFAHLILSGTMTDRQAAEAVGLNPETAVEIKSRPRVSDYILKLRAAAQQQPVEQFNVSRDQVLTRLWAIANMEPERTRNSMSSQVKAMSMIVAIEGLIPDRRAGSAEKKPASALTNLYTGPQTNPALEEDGPGIPEAEPAPGSAADAPLHPGPLFDPGESARSNGDSPTETQAPPHTVFAPDTRVSFSIKKNHFPGRR